MTPANPLTRREALRLLASILALNETAEAFGQNPPAAGETLQAGGVEMHITETRQGAGYVIQITFTRNGVTVFKTRTTMLSRSQNESRTTQTLTDGRGFTYQIEVTAKQGSPSTAPPEVSFRVTIKQAGGQTQEFSGAIGSPSSPQTAKYPPPIDSVLPGSVKEQLSPIQGPLHEKIHSLEASTGVHVNPEKSEPPHVWSERGCHALCIGISGLCTIIVCGGTAGLGCAIATVGFLMAGSYCADTCPK